MEHGLMSAGMQYSVVSAPIKIVPSMFGLLGWRQISARWCL